MEYLIVGGSSLAWVVPKNYIEKVGDAGFKKNPIGCGPYKFVEFIPGVKLVGEAFEQYWRKVPKIRRMEFYTVSEPGTRLAMVKRGEADIATLMQGVFYQDVKKSPNLRLLSPLSPTRHIVYFTTQWDPKSPWSDQRVRLAASLAIDRQTLADVQSPGSSPVGSISMEGDPMAVQLPAHPYDPARAKKLLAEAGYPNGLHGGRFYPFQGGYWPMGEQIANYWKAVVFLDTVLSIGRPFGLAVRAERWGNVFIDSAIVPIGGRLSWLLGAGAYGTYPDVQTPWEEYRKSTDPKIRKDLIAQVQKLIYEKDFIFQKK
jgi:peptide/nickel transport system substrate-binding protein